MGKGSGGRLKKQERRFCLKGKILQTFKTEADAFAAEVEWVARLKPTENKNSGGGGGVCSIDPDSMPEMLKGAVSEKVWRKEIAAARAEIKMIELSGLRKHAASLMKRTDLRSQFLK